jgi:PleD family two-component response regulator
VDGGKSKLSKSLSLRFTGKGQLNPAMTVNIGTATVESNKETLEDLLKRADMALVQAEEIAWKS